MELCLFHEYKAGLTWKSISVVPILTMHRKKGVKKESIFFIEPFNSHFYK